MRPKVQLAKIIYLLFSFEGRNYTVKAEFEILANTELYCINVDQPALKNIVGDSFSNVPGAAEFELISNERLSPSRRAQRIIVAPNLLTNIEQLLNPIRDDYCIISWP